MVMFCIQLNIIIHSEQIFGLKHIVGYKKLIVVFKKDQKRNKATP
jgi:hypothetical protein